MVFISIINKWKYIDSSKKTELPSFLREKKKERRNHLCQLPAESSSAHLCGTPTNRPPPIRTLQSTATHSNAHISLQEQEQINLKQDVLMFGVLLVESHGEAVWKWQPPPLPGGQLVEDPRGSFFVSVGGFWGRRVGLEHRLARKEVRDERRGRRRVLVPVPPPHFPPCRPATAHQRWHPPLVSVDEWWHGCLFF